MLSTHSMSSLPARASWVSMTGPALMFLTATTPYSAPSSSMARTVPWESILGSSSGSSNPIFSAKSMAACSELDPGMPM